MYHRYTGAGNGWPILPRAIYVVVGVTTETVVNDHRYCRGCHHRTLSDATTAKGRGSDDGDDSVQLVAASPAVRQTVRSSRAGRPSAKWSSRPGVIVVVVGSGRARTVHTRDVVAVHVVLVVKVRRRAIPVGGLGNKR